MGINASPHILFGKVMHARLFPKKNKFRYGIYYLSLPLSKREGLPIAYNRPGAISFYDADHGTFECADLEGWARGILEQYGIKEANGEIVLICMPRIFGYVFNPVSFWLCHDKMGKVRAIICEVHNTFKERHSYLCTTPDHRAISHHDVLDGEKLFHVSPFLEREGNYTFRFDFRDGKFGAWINYYDKNNKKKLITSLIGQMVPMTNSNIKKAVWRYPLITMKTIFLIHWQATKLVAKGIKYISKPLQRKEKISATNNVTKI